MVKSLLTSYRLFWLQPWAFVGLYSMAFMPFKCYCFDSPWEGNDFLTSCSTPSILWDMVYVLHIKDLMHLGKRYNAANLHTKVLVSQSHWASLSSQQAKPSLRANTAPTGESETRWHAFTVQLFDLGFLSPERLMNKKSSPASATGLSPPYKLFWRLPHISCVVGSAPRWVQKDMPLGTSPHSPAPT